MYKANIFTLLLFAFTVSPLFLSCNNSSASKHLDNNTSEPTRESKHFFEVEYSTPWLDINIHDGKITQISTDHHFAPSSYKDMPDSVFTDEDLSDVAVSTSTMGKLSLLIRNSGFMDLKDTYGAASNESHPYILTVRRGKQFKSVTFRSSPFTKEAPEAFQAVEAFVKGIAADLLK